MKMWVSMKSEKCSYLYLLRVCDPCMYPICVPPLQKPLLCPEPILTKFEKKNRKKITQTKRQMHTQKNVKLQILNSSTNFSNFRFLFFGFQMLLYLLDFPFRWTILLYFLIEFFFTSNTENTEHLSLRDNKKKNQ